MMVAGEKTSKMDKDLKHGQMGQNILESIRKGASKATASCILRTDHNMKANFLKIILLEKDICNGMMGKHIEEIG